mmetsp:Transcript_71211/g.148592  ORF Transcript_71211/g.148592 Transcript_71211/m.148592 type:complete len:951 (+) Transcript_71211:1853-4705(+)
MLELRSQLDKLLAAKLIEPSDSPYAAPVLFAPKKDGGWRMCVDYRALNRNTVRDKFPLPHHEDLFDELKDSKWFSKIDLLWGYWHIPIDPEDKPKTAFVTQWGLFQWAVLPFGLSNAPSAFSRMVGNILKPCRDFAIAFIDDVLIHSRTLEDHIKHVSRVLSLLEENSLRTKPSKCEFFVQETTFLGHLISSEGVAPDPKKTDAIEQWPSPRDQHQLRSFLGLASYYRRFIRGFAGIGEPLFPLLSKDKPWNWTPACEAAFRTLKRVLTCAPVLRPYDPDAACSVLDTDSSSFAIAATLMQGPSMDDLHVVAYYSRKMNGAERNYTTREQELLAIKEGLRHWKHYTYRTEVKVRTDHDSLRWIFTQNNLTGRLARWLEFLADFQIVDILHVKGKDNVVADALSRRPDYAEVAMLFEITPLESEVGTLATPVSETFLDLMKEQSKDAFCKKLVHDLTYGVLDATDPIRERFHVVNGALMWFSKGRYRIVVPPGMRKLLLAEAHDSKVAGHRGVDKTYAAISEVYYWPNLYNDVLRYVTTCNSCQLNKPSHVLGGGPLKPIPIPELPFLEVGLDFVGPLPATKRGNNFLLTVVDYSTRVARFIPCRSSEEHPISAQETARLYFDYVFRYHGLPAILRTDRGSQFTGEFFREVFQLCGAKQALGTAYHPQSQGLVEHLNRTAIEGLRHYLHGLYEDWDEHIVAVEFAYNHSLQPSLGITPFEALYGYNPRSPLTLAAQSAIPAASEFMQKLKSKIDAARDAILATQLKQAETANKSRSSTPWKVGEYAALSTQHLNLAYPTKFTPKWLGPFKVLEVMPRGNAVKLELPPTMGRLENVFSTDRLRRHKMRDDSIGPPDPVPPPPVFADDPAQPYFAIERILAERPCRWRGQDTVKYLIRWAGYGAEHDSWVQHPWFKDEPGGEAAIAAWRAREAAVPVPAAQDRAARHRLRPRA